MRRTMLAIALGACTRADEAPTPPPVSAPAVRPVDPVDREAELVRLAKQLVDVTPSGCNFVVANRPSGLESKRTIPLDEVTWTLDVDDKRRVVASCRTRPSGCIWTASESRTLDIPHEYSRHHAQVEWDKLVVAADVKDPAKLVAELDRAARFCKRP